MSKSAFKSYLGKKKHAVYRRLSPTLTRLSSKWLKFMLETHKKGDAEDAIFSELGIYPILDQYYHPLINPKKHLKKSLRADRNLPGVNFNAESQLALLNRFNYNEELLEFPIEKRPGNDGDEFFYNNGFYESGDAEYLYNIIRFHQPSKIIEIGSGNSTLMAINAITKNKSENPTHTCEHICIEPYEMPWLEGKDLKIIREKVEDMDLAFFEQLGPNDILFIDSSHVIRPQGDVLFEYLELLPLLKPGVIVHIHDIFMPKDYPDQWVFDLHRLWNEQYLLEAFLSMNNQFSIIGATNYLAHNYTGAFAAKCPIFAQQPGREPGAFWMQRV